MQLRVSYGSTPRASHALSAPHRSPDYKKLEVLELQNVALLILADLNAMFLVAT